MFQKGIERIDLFVPVHLAMGDLVKKYPQIPFPKGKKVHQISDNGPLKPCVFKDLIDIAKVCVQANDRLSAGVVDHIFNLKRGVDWRDRYNHCTNLLDTKKGDNPLDTVGDIDHNPVALLDTHVNQGTGKAFTQLLQM